MSTNNILVPSGSRPIVTPTQDMVIGIYYLTSQRPGALGEGKYFNSIDEVRHAYDAGAVSLHAQIILRQPDGSRLETTPGRLFFNEIMPEGFQYINDVIDKKKLGNLVEVLYSRTGASETAKTLDQIMRLGFYYSTRSGTTVSVEESRPASGTNGYTRRRPRLTRSDQFRRGLHPRRALPGM